MPIELYDEVGGNIDTDLVKKIFDATLAHFGMNDDVEVEICIVDEDTIKEVNKSTRGIEKVTDVLSFPTLTDVFPFDKNRHSDDINPDSGRVMLGELMLCEKRAKEQAQEYGHSVEREYGYLVLHGLLHLLGFDHIEEKDKAEMRRHEEEILESLGIVRG
ncbi:MAG: rRNA maturation RNase YbeY [Christensenellales bacterium]